MGGFNGMMLDIPQKDDRTKFAKIFEKIIIISFIICVIAFFVVI